MLWRSVSLEGMLLVIFLTIVKLMNGFVDRFPRSQQPDIGEQDIIVCVTTSPLVMETIYFPIVHKVAVFLYAFVTN